MENVTIEAIKPIPGSSLTTTRLLRFDKNSYGQNIVDVYHPDEAYFESDIGHNPQEEAKTAYEQEVEDKNE